MNITEYIVNEIISRLNRHAFFKGRDMEEWVPFITAWLYQKGIYVHPVGIAWCSETTKENAEKYMDEHQDLYDEYAEWCDSQR